jgi:general stress protein CsbA
MLFLNIPQPDWIAIVFFIVLLAGSFYVGAWLQGKEPRQ